MARHGKVLSSAIGIGVCTLLSRVTGLLRDMLLVQSFGLGWVFDAFNYGFLIPNLFRRIFGEGALAAVFVPTFSRTLERRGRENAWELLARTIGLLSLTLTTIVVVLEVAVLVAWFVLVGGADDPDSPFRHLLLALTALMLPVMLTVCLLALLSSILNCLHSFVPPALTPVILNIFMITGILMVGPWLSDSDPAIQIYAVAISVVAAGVAQILFLIPFLRRHGVRLGFRVDWRDPEVRRMIGLMAPVALGQGVLLFGVFLDAQMCVLLMRGVDGEATGSFLGLTFAYPLEPGALSAITVAQRLYQFPLGVLGISLAVAALPTLSQLAARADWVGWAREGRSALRLTIFLGLLAGALMIVLAEPIVQLLFEYRRFDAQDTPRAARLLACYGFGMWAFCAQHIVLRGFYSLGDVVTPLKISCFLVPVNIAISLSLVWFEGVREAAFGIATSTTSTLTVVFGLIVLQRRTDVPWLDRHTIRALLLMLLAAGATSVVVWVAWPAWRDWVTSMIPGEIVQRGVSTLGALGIGIALYIALAALLRIPEAGQIIRRGGRIRRRRVPSDEANEGS